MLAIHPQEKTNRKNEEIKATQLRLLDPQGEMLGVVSLADALARADEAELDLVEIQPHPELPVCRLMDFDKFRYECQKKAQAAKRKQHRVEIKEVKLRPVTDEGDYQIKLRNARRFLEEGDKVKFTVAFKGRELSHQELGREMIARIERELVGVAVVESRARLEGRHMVMLLAPALKK